MHVEIRRVTWPYKSVFRIAYKVRTEADTVVIELTDGGLTGRGEAMGVSYHGETPETIVEQLTNVKARLEKGVTREELQSLMPPGGARCAVDCALWDLEAKRAKRRAWELAGMSSVKPLLTDYTLGVDTPEAMGAAAAAGRQFSLFKVKLAGGEDLERVAAVRKARPDADIIVDANQAWNEQDLHTFTPKLAALGVKLIEQPMAVGQDAALAGFKSPVPMCADESCQTTDSLPSLVGKYQFVNIKLDKTGGLTEALRLAEAARRANFGLMVGCMGGSSLAMAPAFIIGQFCTYVDLDGPLLTVSDLPNAIRYDGGRMSAPEAALWG
jgi:L-alanine-DL-glutamate epimerase-like enolase superfamily enzyme